MFFPNLDWGTFFYAGGEDSAYKGMVRNVLMSSLAKAQGLKVGANGMFSRTSNQLVNGGLDPDYVAKTLLGPQATRQNLKNVESIYAALANDRARDTKLSDFREYLGREGLKEPGAVNETTEVNFLAKLRDRIVNQGMMPLIEAEKSANPYQIYEAEETNVGGRAKGIEHLEDLVFRKGSRGVAEALAIVQAAADQPSTTTVKWDGKPALIFGRKPATGEFVLTDGSGFEAKGYDGLATSPEMMADIQSKRSGDREGLIQLYATLFPILEAALPANFRGYVKGDLLYMPLTKSYFEIKRVEATNPFFQLGKLHVYKLQCELWQYSSEDLNTGVAEIDSIEARRSMSISDYQLITEAGDRIILENNAYNVEDSGFLLWEGWTISTQDPLADNLDFKIEALDILDFTEINPFGEVIRNV
jgi:hypothetical protein